MSSLLALKAISRCRYTFIRPSNLAALRDYVTDIGLQSCTQCYSTGSVVSFEINQEKVCKYGLKSGTGAVVYLEHKIKVMAMLFCDSAKNVTGSCL